MALAASTIEQLRSLVGVGCVAEACGQIAVSPRTTEELAATARYANSNKLPVEIAGAGTKRDWGNPVSAQIVLKTTSLAGVTHHSWQDLIATVRAGTPWAAMRRALSAHNQQVALDPLWPEQATVGGIVATNDSGALRLRYGSLRDLIIGMTVVLADGTIAKSGGKVVKNVAGYDLHKLMTGAFGTLGIVAEITFRLHPISARSATLTIHSRTAEPLGDLAIKILDSHLVAQAMQLRANTDQFALDVQLASLPQVLATQSERLRDLAKNVSASLNPEPSDPTIFEARQNLFATPERIILKITMLPTAIAKLSTAVGRLGGEAVTQAAGIMFARFRARLAADALPSLRAHVDAAGGTLTMVRAPSFHTEWATQVRGAEGVPPLMREIKRRFDPNRILNPGRFLGGI